MASSDWSKQFFKPMNIDFAFKAFRKLASFVYGRFEFDAVGDIKLMQRRKKLECKKLRKLAPTRQQPFTKECVGINISESTHGALLWEKVFCSLQSETTSADVDKIKASECHSVPVL